MEDAFTVSQRRAAVLLRVRKETVGDAVRTLGLSTQPMAHRGKGLTMAQVERIARALNIDMKAAALACPAAG